MTVKLQTKHHSEILSLTGGCTGSSESTLVKMPHCWKSHDTAHLVAIAAETSLLKSRIFSDFYSSLYVVLVLIDHLSLFTMTDLIEQSRLPKEMFVEILTLKELNHTGGSRQFFV